MRGSPPALLALSFFLGMRHATDADHVIAVTTIVCRQRRLRGAAALGALWGLGHTVTILIVGGAIILFDVVIPPRLGLGLEMAVAGMLILLGSLNLRGETRPLRASAHVHAPNCRSSSFGLVLAYRLGIIDGLFTGAPRWTPQ